MTKVHKITATLPKPPMTDPERDTLGLIVQALKYAYVEHYDTLQGSSRNQGALRNNAKFLAEKLNANCMADIGRLYKLIEKNKGRVDSEMDLYQPYYDAIDFVKEAIETAMILSVHHKPEGVETFTGGIEIARSILKDVREGKVGFTTEEKFEGMKKCGMI